MSITQSEDELIYLYQQGNEECLEMLVQRYIPYIRSQIKKYRINGFDVEDMLQESRIVMHRAIKTFDYRHNVCFFTYLNRLLHNHFCRLLRQTTTKKRHGDHYCVSYDEFDMDSYIGRGYNQSLDPLDVLLVRECFDTGYDTLTKSEKTALHHKYYLNEDAYKRNHHLYRGEKKIKQSIRCK